MSIDIGSDAPMGLPNSVLDAVLDSGLGNGALLRAVKFRRYTRGAIVLEVVSAISLVDSLDGFMTVGVVDVIPLTAINVAVDVVKDVVAVSVENDRRVLLSRSDGWGYSPFHDEQLLVIVR